MDKDYKSPEEIYGDLFYDIHRENIFEDGKTFADARALLLPAIILKKYADEKHQNDFNLLDFVKQYFELPLAKNDSWKSDTSVGLAEHVKGLWDRLERPADRQVKRSSKVALPFPYVVPGGRFNEIYYWDSYFTMLGLVENDRMDLVEGMVSNFQYLIESIGHIPNGNRSYFLSRSQPPFYSLMVKLLIQKQGRELIGKYMKSLVMEYNFWMSGIQELTGENGAVRRVTKIDKEFLLNRYYDDKDTPREEMYGDDWELIEFGNEKNNELFRHLRAACESGWDFSSRWLADDQDLKSIQTLDILPVDLNCLLWHHEKLLAECYEVLDKGELSLQYGMLANQRKKAIVKYFWNEDLGFFCDYNHKEGTVMNKLSLAGIFPLYFGLASDEQAESCKNHIENTFLKKGGLVSTPYETGHQWDAPNGWAPLHWMTIKGLLKYNYKDLAREVASRWTQLNESVYQRTGKMLEKYNVVDIELEGGGGEYPIQDGFGWTNGVYLAIKGA